MAYVPKRPPLNPCPVEEVVALIGGEWKARILGVLALGEASFATLRRSLPGISQQVLSAQLQALMRDGLVSKGPPIAHGATPRYALTTTGRSLVPVLDQIADWGEARLNARGLEWRRSGSIAS